MSQNQGPSADDVLWGGSSARSAEFKIVGTSVGGKIISKPQSYHTREYDKLNPGQGPLKYYPSGDPIMGIRVDVQTTLREDADDDGVRRFYLESQRQLGAVRDAVRAVDAPGLQQGGVLVMTFTGTEEGQGSIPAKTWAASYSPAGVAVPGGPPVSTPPQYQAGPPPAWASAPAPTPAPTPAAAPPATAPAGPTVTETQAAAMRNAGIDTSLFAVVPG